MDDSNIFSAVLKIFVHTGRNYITFCFWVCNSIWVLQRLVAIKSNSFRRLQTCPSLKLINLNLCSFLPSRRNGPTSAQNIEQLFYTSSNFLFLCGCVQSVTWHLRDEVPVRMSLAQTSSFRDVSSSPLPASVSCLFFLLLVYILTIFIR